MKKLSEHKILGIDLDGTLFEHDSTPMFVDFIKQYPYDQEFRIITFRSHGIEDLIDDDLESIGLDRGYFASVRNVSDSIYYAYEMARKSGRDEAAIDRYITWKGMICQKIGATVLLDDMTDLVIQGCDRYGIEHIHPDDLTDWRG